MGVIRGQKQTQIMSQIEACGPVLTEATKEGTRTWVPVIKRTGLSSWFTQLQAKVEEGTDLFSSQALQEGVRPTLGSDQEVECSLADQWSGLAPPWFQVEGGKRFFYKV